jgi:aspartate-semialdehyde dehydrogenase
LSAIAILHPTNLLGKELRETIGARHPEWSDVRLMSTDDDEIGTLTEVGGAAALVSRYAPVELEGVDLAFFCGPAEVNRPILAELPPGTRGILLSADATAEDGPPVVAGVNPGAARGHGVVVSPHPAVVLLAHLLHPLRGFGLEEAVTTVIQPASMKEEPGLEELFENARQILSMAGRKPTLVFGTQLAFNLLPVATGTDPLVAQLHAVLAAPPGERRSLSVQVLQGGVFHSISASLYVRCGAPPSLQAFRKALAENPVLEPAEKPRILGPIDAAGSDKVIYGSLRKDESGGFWLWAVMDNLTRGGALNAVEMAEELL